jgi:hypothetical protein
MNTFKMNDVNLSLQVSQLHFVIKIKSNPHSQIKNKLYFHDGISTLIGVFMKLTINQ